MAKHKKKVHPWERLPKEGDAAWQDFTVFIGISPPRRLQMCATLCNKNIQTINGMSAKWKWRDRVAAYDAHLWNIRCNARIAAYEETTKKQMDALELTRRVTAQRLTRLAEKAKANEKAIEEMTITDAISGLNKTIKSERLILGYATERIEQKLANDRSIPIDFSGLTTKEIEQLQAALPLLEKVGIVMNDDDDDE